MTKEINRVENKMNEFFGNEVLATFNIINNTTSGEFIIFETKDDNIGFVLTKCHSGGKLQKEHSKTWKKLSNIIGNELAENIDEVLANI